MSFEERNERHEQMSELEFDTELPQQPQPITEHQSQQSPNDMSNPETLQEVKEPCRPLTRSNPLVYAF